MIWPTEQSRVFIIPNCNSSATIPRMESSLFDWLAWRGGSPLDVFRLGCRSEDLISGSHLLREYAVGWCEGERLPCRPKLDMIAVMFFKDGRNFWFHLSRYEFERIFAL